MKSDRNMPMMPFGMPTNMMMFPNYMNDNYQNIDNKINTLDKKINTLENRISRLEGFYQNTPNNNYQNNQNQNNTNQTCPYQATQNNGYNGDMYMM